MKKKIELTRFLTGFKLNWTPIYRSKRRESIDRKSIKYKSIKHESTKREGIGISAIKKIFFAV